VSVTNNPRSAFGWEPPDAFEEAAVSLKGSFVQQAPIVSEQPHECSPSL